MQQWNKMFKQYGKIFTQVDEETPAIAKIFKKHRVKKILDLGCGTGRHTVYLAKKGFDVYGIDIAAEGIKITKSWLKEKNLKANLKIGSIYKKLPYRDNFFEAVISTNVIHHAKIEDIRKAIGEIERVLKPKGLIFITVRRRKFKKFWSKGKIIERYKKQKVAYKVIGPRTYVPTEGGEKGLVHYLFNKELIRKEFKNFKIYNIWADSNKRHYCILAELKISKDRKLIEDIVKELKNQKTITVVIDRPQGTRQQKNWPPYPFNYGHIGIMNPVDNENFDALASNFSKLKKRQRVRGEIIGVVRRDDLDYKLITAKPGTKVTQPQLNEIVKFYEPWFKGLKVEVWRRHS